MIAALYVDPKGVYSGLPDVECWGLPDRDAREYAGPWPVVAHPPCSRWCQLAYMNQKRYGHRVGDDGGCFEAALHALRRFGGVLEHPARSYAWHHFGLIEPQRGCWSRGFGNYWVAEVAQSAYGHRARKLTWLCYIGNEGPPALDWSAPEPTAQVSFCGNHGDSPLPRLSKREASATPPLFRDALLAIARSANLQHDPRRVIV